MSQAVYLPGARGTRPGQGPRAAGPLLLCSEAGPGGGQPRSLSSLCPGSSFWRQWLVPNLHELPGAVG